MAIVWDTTTGDSPLARVSSPSGGGTATFFRPGSATSLVTIDANNHSWEWDLQRDSELLTTSPGVNLGASVSDSPETLALVSSPAGVIAYDPAGEAVREVSFDSGDSPIRAIAASGDGTRFVVAYDDGRLELRDAVSGDLVIAFAPGVRTRAFDESFSVRRDLMIAVDRGGTRVAYQAGDDWIYVVADDGTTVESINLSVLRSNLQALDLSDDGTELVLSTQAGDAIWYEVLGIRAARIADPVSLYFPECVVCYSGYDAQFVSDHRVAVVGPDGVRIIDPRSLQTTRRYDLRTDARRLALDNTGELLATVDGSGAVQLWDADLVAPIGEPLQIRNVSSSVPIRFSADGHHLLVSGLEEVTWVNVWTANWRQVGCSLITDALSPVDLARLGFIESVEPCR